MSWVDFRNQALQDMKSVHTLYDSKDYGNSAYLLQQSIEKFIKSIVIHYNLSSKSMITLGHMPLDELWDDLQQRMKELIGNSSSDIAKKNYQNMSETINTIKDFFEKSTKKELRTALWKDSLKIPLSKNEEKIILDFINKLKEELKPQIHTLSTDLFELFEHKIKPFFERMPNSHKQEIQRLLDDIQLDVDLEKLDNIQISTHLNIDEFAKEIPVFFVRIEKLYHLVRKDPHRIYFLDSDEALMILFSWIFSFSTQILKISAHESIGRYPTEIEKRSSRNWYVEKSEILKDLQNEVEDACRRLNLMIFDKIPHD